MMTLVFAHVFFGLVAIVSGAIAIVGLWCRRRVAIWNGLFLGATGVACATGFVFLPIDGVTSAQLVGFFLIVLLAVAAYARYVERLQEAWGPIYALTTVGALFLNVLIAIAQSFQHVQALREMAPTQHSPIYVGLKFALLAVFVVIALLLGRRSGNI